MWYPESGVVHLYLIVLIPDLTFIDNFDMNIFRFSTVSTHFIFPQLSRSDNRRQELYKIK